jgi:hypothetical protein
MVCSKPGYGPCADSIALRLRAPSQPGHAFVQNLRRGHYAITADLPPLNASASGSTTSLYPSKRHRWRMQAGTHPLP